MTKSASVQIGFSTALIAGGTYALCALAVAISPAATQAFLSYMMHVDLTTLSRPLSVGSFLIGIVLFSALLGTLAYCTARVYGWLNSQSRLRSARGV